MEVLYRVIQIPAFCSQHKNYIRRNWVKYTK